MHIVPPGHVPDHTALAAALERGAYGPGEQAAVTLLLAIPGPLYASPEITPMYVITGDGAFATTPVARVRWAQVADWATASPWLSDGERTALLLAVRLVEVGAALPAMDSALRAAARVALARLAGVSSGDVRPLSGDGSEPLPDGVDGHPVGGRGGGWVPGAATGHGPRRLDGGHR